MSTTPLVPDWNPGSMFMRSYNYRKRFLRSFCAPETNPRCITELLPTFSVPLCPLSFILFFMSSVVCRVTYIQYTRSAAQLSIAVASSRRVSAYYYNRKVRKKVLPRLRSSPTHFYVAYAILAWRYASLSSLFSLP